MSHFVLLLDNYRWVYIVSCGKCLVWCSVMSKWPGSHNTYPDILIGCWGSLPVGHIGLGDKFRITVIPWYPNHWTTVMIYRNQCLGQFQICATFHLTYDEICQSRTCLKSLGKSKEDHPKYLVKSDWLKNMRHVIGRDESGRESPRWTLVKNWCWSVTDLIVKKL